MTEKRSQKTIDKTVAKWYIFHTYPRAEKIVYKNLVSKGYEVFLPLKRIRKIWKNRQYKIIEEPLFSSYIFVKTTLKDIYKIVKEPKICTYISFSGKPSTIPDKEIKAIQIMVLSEKGITTNEFYEGEKVRIINGFLTGYEGLLYRKKGINKFGIKIKGINTIASTEISISDIKHITRVSDKKSIKKVGK